MSKKRIKEEFINVKSLPKDVKYNSTFVINPKKINHYTHSYFKYPCKYIPEIPKWAINKYVNEKSSKIFDPFSGSGTTLLESNLLGHDSYGTEIDELAKLLIKVKTTPFENNEIISAENHYNNIINKLKNWEKEIDFYRAKINNLNHWFDEDKIKKLGIIKNYIDNIENHKVKDFMLICFASIIRNCSKADDSSPKPYVSSKYPKKAKEPINEFRNIFNNYIKKMNDFSNNKNSNKISKIISGNALDIKEDLSVDLIITSPPYINAFDYVRILRLETIWLGLVNEKELRNQKKLYVGTEKIDKESEKDKLHILSESNLLKEYYYKLLDKDAKRALIVKKFFEDMKTNLIEMKKILKTNGKYCLVIGNNNIRNINIESWKVIQDIAEKNGYKTDLYFNYIIQNHYLNIPRKGRGGKIKKDHVLVLNKKGDS